MDNGSYASYSLIIDMLNDPEIMRDLNNRKNMKSNDDSGVSSTGTLYSIYTHKTY